VHGVGFRFIAPFAMAPGAGGATHAGQWLIGREADLARLQDALAAAHAGHRQLVFITGEAGIGKTAVVQTFVEGLLTYAMGRTKEYYDMPTVRKIVRETAAKDYKFPAIVQAAVKSEQFRMRRVPPPAQSASR